MVWSPAATFAFYMVAIVGILTLCAFVADTWTRKVERDARRRARAEARASRMIGERSSSIDG